MRAFPLSVAYVLFPGVMLIGRLLDMPLPRNLVEALWISLAVLALAVILVRRAISLRSSGPAAAMLIAMAGVITLLFVRLVVPLSMGREVEWIPLAMELKPVFYLLIAMLWIWAFLPPKPGDFVRAGMALGALILSEIVIVSIWEGAIVRPRGSGEINYDACLLLLSALFAFERASAWRFLGTWVIMLALLATFSRTAMLAMVAIFLFGGRGWVLAKIAVVAVAGAFIVGSFLIRELPLDALNRLDRYWMWASAFDLLTTNPWSALLGFPLGASLPVEAPRYLASLWAAQAEGWGVEGVFPFNYHSFWLRVIIDWGALLAGGALVLLTWLGFSNKRSKLERGVAWLILAEGATMGLFFLSNVAIPLVLAMVAIYSPSVRWRNRVAGTFGHAEFEGTQER